MPPAPHRRLLAWQLARGLAADAIALTRTLPADLAALAGQIDRAALASLEAIVEGAEAPDGAPRAMAFALARGEMRELEATLDAYELLGFGATRDLCARAERVAALLSGLEQRAEAGCVL